MCGIVGYMGTQNTKKRLIEGLKRLEYRGYDSSGMAILDRSFLQTFKTVGRVKNLEQKVKHLNNSKIGIAHTRWATHGAVNLVNAHPHSSSDGRFAIVHNGVIDNYKALISDHLKDISFESETDTEVIANLLMFNVNHHNYEEAIQKTLQVLKGSYALVIIDKERPNQLIVAKNKSPLIVGKNSGEIMIASDVLALAGYVNHIHTLEDETFMIINETDYKLYDLELNQLKPTFDSFNLDPIQSERGHYSHYMLKEIAEQPEVLRRLVNHFNVHPIDPSLQELILKASSIEIIAAGTSFHAGLYAKNLFERILFKATHVHVASEFAYYPPELSNNPLFIFISQSGETADLIACLPHIKKSQCKLITLSNVATSRLAKEADVFFDLLAGPEIAVASTKAFTAEVALIALVINQLNPEFHFENELLEAANAMDTQWNARDTIKAYIETHFIKHNAFYIGRGIDYTIALEASLKLKEISYIQSEAFPAGELKHGTIALIEQDTPVISILTEDLTAGLTRANIEEVRARGANSLVISKKSLSQSQDDIIIPDIHPLIDPLMAVIPTQLVAYYAALQRGHDIDKPRNLAKSVTVE